MEESSIYFFALQNIEPFMNKDFLLTLSSNKGFNKFNIRSDQINQYINR